MFIYSLDDVILRCQQKFKLEVNTDNRKKYVAFLQRQLRAHPDYDLDFKVDARKCPFPYFNLMVDKLLLFSYLIGEVPIIAGYEGHTEEKKIKSVEDLYLLRPAEIGVGGGLNYEQCLKRQTDRRLFDLCARLRNRNTTFGFPNWGESVDELGNDAEVMKHFRQKITYGMVKNCPSPNPLTYSHGGYRGGYKKNLTN